MDERPEQIIAEVYRQVHDLRLGGTEPREVLMSLDRYRLLDWYRKFLGEEREQEYLQQFHLFGLEILIEDIDHIIVR